MGLSVIIPVAEGDSAWKELLPDLRSLAVDDAIVISSKTNLEKELRGEADRLGLAASVRWVGTEVGRARQLNAGARAAPSEHYWFLHCDSKLTKHAVSNLKRSIGHHPQAILFFNLKFLSDGPIQMPTNEFGVWLRSRILRLPFGDQGFCMHNSTFKELGGFSETAPYGEDHLLIWCAHQKKIKLHCVGEALYTSARRYQTEGWAKTTGKHLRLTAHQAIPELGRLIKNRIIQMGKTFQIGKAQ